MSIFDNVAFAPRMAGVRERARLQEIVERCLRQAALFEEVKDRLDAARHPCQRRTAAAQQGRRFDDEIVPMKTIQLVQDKASGQVKELVIATNPTLEGEATAMYIRRYLGDRALKVTHLARGLPVGGSLEYSDELTLSRAFQGRQEM
jgi:hypothetical protein